MEIHCGLEDDENHYGSVDTYFNISKFIEEQHAGFGYWGVPSRITNHGIG